MDSLLPFSQVNIAVIPSFTVLTQIKTAYNKFRVEEDEEIGL